MCKTTGTAGSYTVLDVAFSPSELQRAKQHRAGGGAGELDPQVYLLALSFAQREHGLRLSEQYRVTSASSRPGGSLQDVQRRLAFRQQPGRPASGGAAGPDAGRKVARIRGFFYLFLYFSYYYYYYFNVAKTLRASGRSPASCQSW